MNKALNRKEAVNSVTVDSEVSFSLNLAQILVNVNILNFERHNKNILTGVFFWVINDQGPITLKTFLKN